MIRQSFKLANGRSLAWSEVGSGPDLVMLHGWALSGNAFSELADLLATEYRLLIPDLPGHGESSAGGDLTLPGLAADLGDWLATVGQGSLALCGWSLGGMLALELARGRQLSVGKLVLIGVTPRFTVTGDWPFGLPATQVRAMKRNLGRRFEATLADFFKLSFEGETIAPERLRSIRSFAVRAGRLPDPAAAAALLDLLGHQDQRRALPGIEQPVLVLHGDRDRIAPIEAARAMAAGLPGARLHEFAGIGHAPFLSHPEQVAGLIREFA